MRARFVLPAVGATLVTMGLFAPPGAHAQEAPGQAAPVPGTQELAAIQSLGLPGMATAGEVLPVDTGLVRASAGGKSGVFGVDDRTARGARFLLEDAGIRCSWQADVVVVVGTPLDFRLSFGSFGSAEVIHVVDSAEQRAGHVQVAASPAGVPSRAVVQARGSSALAASATERRWASAAPGRP